MGDPAQNLYKSVPKGEKFSVPPLILASASPRRLQLLSQIGVSPDRVLATDCDEAVLPRETPRALAKRLAQAKADAASRQLQQENAPPALILAADTVVARGRMILPKAETLDEARDCLHLLSGRNHNVITAITLINQQGQNQQAQTRSRLVESRVTFKRLSDQEIQFYLQSGEWQGKAGGYAIQGLASLFITHVIGSYSSIVGLPLYETAALLQGAHYPLMAKDSAL